MDIASTWAWVGLKSLPDPAVDFFWHGCVRGLQDFNLVGSLHGHLLPIAPRRSSPFLCGKTARWYPRGPSPTRPTDWGRNFPEPVVDRSK